MTLISTLSAFSARVVERVQKSPRADTTEAAEGAENHPSTTPRVRNGGDRPIVFPRNGASDLESKRLDSRENELPVGPRAARQTPIGRRSASAVVWSEGVTNDFPILSNCSGHWVDGNLGRACLQSSERSWRLQGPAIVFDSEEDLVSAFEDGELERDFVAIVRFQGRRAQGESRQLHRAMTVLEQLKHRGWQVALVTDGRASGGAATIPVVDQLVPEALCNGTLRRLLAGDLVRIDSSAGQLQLMVDEQRILARDPAAPDLENEEEVEAAPRRVASQSSRSK